MLNELAKEIYEDNVAAGWWGPEMTTSLGYATKFALIHSETSEAFEGFRKDKMDDHLTERLAVEVELADQMIRTLDLAGSLGLDLDGAIREKREYNQKRLDHKKEAREAPGGKKF